jgi:hypothetical protein
MDIGWPELLFFAVIFFVLCGVVAALKGRSVGPWIALGFIFGPIAFIVLLCLPSKRSVPASADAADAHRGA